MLPIWTVPPLWAGDSAFIIAGGTSVLNEDLSRLRGRRVIVINSSYEAYPLADFLFFGDRRWYYHHWKRPAFLAFAGRKATCSIEAPGDSLLRLKRIVPPPGLALEPNAVASQRTSLQGAMNLAFHLGARRMVLIGADFGRGEGGRSHHHEPHPWRNKPGDATWESQAEHLRHIVAPLHERGIEVINTSPISRLDWFPKMTLEEALR